MDSNNRNALFGGIASEPREVVSTESIDAEVPSSPRKTRTTKTKQAKEQSAPQTKRKTSLYLSPEKFKNLKILCAEMETSMTTFIEDAIDAKMKSEYRKRGKELESQEALEA